MAKLLIVIFLAMQVLSGCSTGMVDSMTQWAGVGVVTEEKSTFDNSTVVSMTPAFLYGPENTFGNRVKLGARWSSSYPEDFVFIMSYSSDVASSPSSTYTSISGMDININGDISSYSTTGNTNLSSGSYNTVTKTIYTKSENSVVVPYEIFKRMMQTEDCRIRIHTIDGYEDCLFSTERIPGGQSTAILHLREMVLKIETTKKS